MISNNEIKIKDSINSSLEMNSAASEFFKEVNELPDDEIKISFENVIFMSRSFAQEYILQKNKTNKIIDEVNVPESIAPLFNMLEKHLKT
ncbi:hypothetical protein [Methanobrevibacter filiformis]|uniref:STAS domain-containing protein n=1 Tax=Methanobrevibacter filiformis TaxID=55758 RepID=A0A165ZSD2_9EURY|nr:hypothetical protein [Methanobrevibacter filiformis]KZX11098.1 hypothetical protein MBFIL_15300 [Methanobrevibacter filiformis]